MNFKIFASKISGQFKPESGGQFNRYMQYKGNNSNSKTGMPGDHQIIDEVVLLVKSAM